MSALNLYRFCEKEPLKLRVHINVISLALLYILICSLELKRYVNLGSPVFLLGLFSFLQVSIQDTGRERSPRFAWVSIAFGLLTVLLPVKTMLYLSCSSAILFLLESNYGKVTGTAMIIVLVMSPVFQYASSIFSFPIRLELTNLAAMIFQWTGQNIRSQGNTLIFNGNEFSVDPECMGLYMLETSLLLGLLIGHFFLQKTKSAYSIKRTLLILAIITVLNILANLLRIVSLVQFNILPGTAMHEIVGLASLIVYVLIPGSMITQRIVMYKARPLNEVTIHPSRGHWQRSLYVLLVLSLSVAAFTVSKRAEMQKSTSGTIPLVPGYKVQRVDADILKLNKEGALVYIKKIPGFFAVEHNPMICWQGSGYKLSRVSTKPVAGQLVYMARLNKDSDELYTAWWFDNNKKTTISQAAWRWDVFLGAPDYSLINVTSEKPETLEMEVVSILSGKNLAGALSF